MESAIKLRETVSQAAIVKYKPLDMNREFLDKQMAKPVVENIDAVSSESSGGSVSNLSRQGKISKLER